MLFRSLCARWCCVRARGRVCVLSCLGEDHCEAGAPKQLTLHASAGGCVCRCGVAAASTQISFSLFFAAHAFHSALSESILNHFTRSACLAYASPSLSAALPIDPERRAAAIAECTGLRGNVGSGGSDGSNCKRATEIQITSATNYRTNIGVRWQRQQRTRIAPLCQFSPFDIRNPLMNAQKAGDAIHFFAPRID